MTTPPSAIGSSVQLPIIDISPLLQHHASPDIVSAVDDAIARACTDVGFFYIVGHGIPAELQSELQCASAHFFSLDATLKQKVAMAAGGKAWRGVARCMVALLCLDLMSSTLQVGSLSVMS